MDHLIDYDMDFKSHYAELLKEADQARAAKIARGDTPRPSARWWTVVLWLAALAGGLVFLTGGLPG